MRIESFAAPTMVTWQLTRDCDLACLHCCTDSAPGKALPGELTREQALKLAGEIAKAGVPYAMIVGGEPTLVPHFAEVCRLLSDAEVLLKIETNGQNFDVAPLKGLAIRSIQISLDGATPETYAKQRVNGSLEKAVAACEAVVAAGLPLEVTFAPTKLNIHEAEAVIDLAASLGAFRFNTGKLMRLGTAAKLWDRLEPNVSQYEAFLRMLRSKKAPLELCFEPFSLEEELASRRLEPAGTLLILPDGRVKVAAPLPFTCADLKTQDFLSAWESYKLAWGNPIVLSALDRLAADPSAAAEANMWVELKSQDMPAVV